MEYTRLAHTLFFGPKEELLVLHRDPNATYRPKEDDFPCGVASYREDIKAAARRGIRQDLGVVVEESALQDVYSCRIPWGRHPMTGERTSIEEHFFVWRADQDQVDGIHLNSRRHAGLTWLPFNNLAGLRHRREVISYLIARSDIRSNMEERCARYYHLMPSWCQRVPSVFLPD